MQQIKEIIKPINPSEIPTNTPESASVSRCSAEPFDVGAAIERILERRGVPKMYLKSTLEDFPFGVQIRAKEIPAGYFITGPCGVGKTHLAVAIMRAAIILKSQGAYKIDTCIRGIYDAHFMPIMTLFGRIKAAFGPEARESEDEIISRIADIELLVLDDLGAEKITEWTLQTLYSIIEARCREQKPTIITSNLNIGQIADRTSDRIASRISGMCKVVEMAGKDKRLDFKSAAANDL